MKVVVVIAVGLRPKDLAHAPHLRAIADRGFSAPLEPVFPAVTMTAQASFLTGAEPSSHGIVGNGWYYRDLAEVMFWKQSNHLVEGEKLYEAMLRERPDFRCAKMFWWFNMYARVSRAVTPRPEYPADGRKLPSVHSNPPELGRELQRKFGTFPLFDFWGPAAGIRSTEWIAKAAIDVGHDHDPDLELIYLPHLDYDHQRFGPDDERSQAAVRELDAVIAQIDASASERGARLMVLSEYGIEQATQVVHPNRILREAGYLTVQETSHGEILDAGASRAFAVCDHQIAHVYVRDESDRVAVGSLFEGVDGVAFRHGLEDRAKVGLDHSRAGEWILEAAPGAWFAYPFWLDESKRPDYATTVDIHRKPGYDPVELFIDPTLKNPKLKILKRVLQKKLGQRVLFDIIGTDASIVQGTHGRRMTRDELERGLGAVFIDSSKESAVSLVRAVEVRSRIESALRS